VTACKAHLDEASCSSDTNCFFNPGAPVEINQNRKCEGGELIGTEDRETLDDCNILCFKDPDCVWFTFRTLANTCSLYKYNCQPALEDSTTSYRPFDY
jgi:hypothetical protein